MTLKGHVMSKILIKKLARKMGYVISAYDPARDFSAIRASLLKTLRIDVVLDVGANSGQFATQLRDSGYEGKIISFEPLSSAYRILSEASAPDKKWTALHCALGSQTGSADIFVSKNSWSSSMLEILPNHTAAAPESKYVDKETITVKTLDSLFDEHVCKGEKVFLKIDTQGYTKQVLGGAAISINKISGLLVEISLIPLYSGEPMIGEVTGMLYESGFVLRAMEPEFIDKQSGQWLQVNGLFARGNEKTVSSHPT